MLKTRKITITANRNITPNDVKIIKAKMEALVSDTTVTEIWFGGARGGDTVALRCAFIALIADDTVLGKGPKLVVVVPDTVEKQPKETHVVTAFADQIIELKNPIARADHYAAYGIRNRHMVDHTDEIVAFTDGRINTGTMSCARYAEKQGKKVEIVVLGKL
jgi:predicted Rossmann fold nucleotide-binding protein DprA/Smf involved in DNA uptake